MFDHARSNRIQFHITDRGPKVRFVECRREVSSLPEMALPFMGTVQALRVAQVQAPECKMQRVPGRRNQHQMNVIRHQAVGQNVDPVLGGVLAQPGQVDPVISVREKHTAASVAALSYVMGNARENVSCDTRHGRKLTPRNVYRCMRNECER